MCKTILNLGEQKLNYTNPAWKAIKYSNMHKEKLLTSVSMLGILQR